MFIPLWVLALIVIISIMLGAMAGMLSIAMCKISKIDDGDIRPARAANDEATADRVA